MKTKFFTAILLIAFITMINAIPVFSQEIITYPFDSITIVSAYKFEALCEEDPDEDSYLNGFVEEGDTIYVYVGNVNFVSDANTSGSRIVIITNDAEEIICSWIINGAGYDGTTESLSFSSHITIDPAVGVVKNLNNFTYTAEIEKTAGNQCKFTAKSWQGTTYGTYNMTAGTYEELTELDIVISAYGGI